MQVQFYPESIKQQTWVGRALDLVEPVPQEGVPWPPAWQSGRRAEFEVFLPESIGGDVPAAEAFVTAQIALEHASGAAPPPPVPAPVVRMIAPSSHGSYSVDVPAGVPTVIYQGSANRSYSLIVNAGANDAFLAYGKEADAQGLPLASGGDGFHELIYGTKSSASVLSPAGTVIAVIDGRYDPELGEGDA